MTKTDGGGSPTSDLKQAYEAVATAIEAVSDPADAFRRATELREEVDALALGAAQLRARAAHRVQSAEGLSLGQLAIRLEISKARAAQLIQVAKAGKAE